MGYDVTFQLIDPKAVEAMLERLVAGEPPPPSLFDERSDALEIWTQARARALGVDPELAARTLGQIAAIWSAASLPFVCTRNLAVTYHPIRMEEELRSVPTVGFTSPRWLFPGLVAQRPELDAWLSGRLDGNATVGGYVYMTGDAAQAVKEFYDGLSPALRDRVRPLLAVLRAAQRTGLCVLESTDLLGVESPRREMLSWPGLDRFGLDGGPLSRAEWARLREATISSAGDLDDIADRVLEVDPSDAPLRAAVLAFVSRATSAIDALRFEAKTRPWIERAKGTGVDRAALRDAVGRFAAGDGSPESIVALMAVVARALDDEAPSTELGAEARRAFERVFDRLYDKPIPNEVAVAIGDAWCALHARMPGSSTPFTSWQVRDPGPASRMLEGVLRGASPSEALLGSVAAVLKSFDAWVFAEDDTWGTSFVDAHREVLWALIDLGLSSADPQSQKSARTLWSAAFYREPRLVAHLERALERGDADLAGELAEQIPVSADTEAALGDAWIRLCIATGKAPWFGNELVESGHAPALLHALERYVATADCDAKTAAVAMAMSSHCTENGAYAEAAAIVDVALTVAPPASAADLLFNQACAHAKRGDGSQTARALGRAAALDAKQLLDALKDHDFDAVRDHPEVAALFEAPVDPRALMLKCGAEARAALEVAVALAVSSSHCEVSPAHLLDRLLEHPDAATWAGEQDLKRLRHGVAATLEAQPRSGGRPAFARSLLALLLRAFAQSTGERITPPDLVACALRDPSAFGLAR